MRGNRPNFRRGFGQGRACLIQVEKERRPVPDMIRTLPLLTQVYNCRSFRIYQRRKR
jgi:hypothetical protein